MGYGFLDVFNINMTIIVSGGVIKKYFSCFRDNTLKKINKKEIDDLKRHLGEVENYSKQNIEKRLQAIESIVVDHEYDLRMKFKELVGDK